MGSGFTIYSGSDFGDLLRDPDSPAYLTFSGLKVEGFGVCTATGKSLVLNALKGLGREAKTGHEYETTVALPLELAQVFQSLDFTYLAGYHKDNLDTAAKYHEDIARLTAPSATREMMASQFDPMMLMMLPQSAQEDIQQGIAVLELACDKLDSVTSVLLDGIYMPDSEEVGEELMAVNASFNNFKMWDYVKYMTEPLREKMKGGGDQQGCPMQ
jgi:hypothetical protein